MRLVASFAAAIGAGFILLAPSAFERITSGNSFFPAWSASATIALLLSWASLGVLGGARLWSGRAPGRQLTIAFFGVFLMTVLVVKALGGPGSAGLIVFLVLVLSSLFTERARQWGES